MEIQTPMSSRVRENRNDRVLLVLFLAVFFSGVSWAEMIPMWQTPDEQAHFAQAQDYAAVGHRPNPGPSTSQDIVVSEKLLGTFRDERGNNKFTYHPEFRLPYSNTVNGFDEEEIVKLPVEMRKVFLIAEATGYPPAYYWYIALVNKLIWGQDLITRVFVSRLATVLISTVGVLAVYGLARQVFVRRSSALAAAGLWAFMPMRQFVGSGVTSDALMNAVYPLGLLTLIRFWRRPRELKRFMTYLAIVILGILIKAQSVALLVLGIPLLIVSAIGKSDLGVVSRWLSRAILLIIAFLTATALIRSFPNSFHIPLPAWVVFPEIGSLVVTGRYPSFSDYSVVTGKNFYRQIFPWYFGVYRWLSLTLPIWVYRTIKVVLLLSALGWIVGLMKKLKGLVRWRQLKLVIFSVGLYAVGLLTWNFFYWKSHGFSLGIQGRYFFPNMAEHMILLMGGLILACGARFRKPVVFLAVLGMVIFNWYSWWFVAASYFDVSSFQAFFLQMSQYKPWFFKTPFLPGIIGLGVISSGWFLWEMGVEYFERKENC